jgi:hypothetical protein
MTMGSVLAVLKEEGQKLEIKVTLGNDKVRKISYPAAFSPNLRSCDTAYRKVSGYCALRMKVARSVVRSCLYHRNAILKS